MASFDPKLIDYCSTDAQREKLRAWVQHGSARKAAAELGVHHRTMDRCLDAARRNAARLGYAPGHFQHGTAPGYLMGKVTVQRGPGGDVERVWERQSPTGAALDEAITAALEALAGQVEPLPPLPNPGNCDDDLLTLIPLGDPHFGMMAWKEETGENFDLAIAERITFAAIDRLCSRTPASKVAVLLNLGDFFHADNGTNRTPQSGNTLDVDGRFQKIAQVGVRAMERCIIRLLEKHETVIVRNNRGNHDPHQAAMLSICLAARFHDEPRVTVDTTPSSFWYYRHGKTLIGSTHGDGAKLTDLPLIMADDVPDQWAAARWRVWHCGHFHHDQLKDLVGCTVETHRTLAGNDAWHRHQGYRSRRDVKAIVYHMTEGEVQRIRCAAETVQ